MNVKSRQQENAEATREALLESALSAFIEHGYGGVSIDAIAREARVTKGAFYHHFGSKQELLAECYERQVRTIAEDLDRVPAHVDKWAEAAALAEAFIDSVMARGKRQLSLQEVITVVGWERWKRIDSRHTLRYVGRLVDELAASGELKDYRRETLVGQLYGFLTQAAMSLRDARSKRQAANEVKAIIRDFLYSLRRG
ncbi:MULTISPECIES: TetR family transcriptional regulator [Pseudomonas]|uniref:TetR family transcriptional regulator n=1 Tax=Pseudomonas TaxID=286 RepID=UPI000211FF6C|nr:MULTISPECIES: TetR family transcriptional regulator [Pseudomonas]SCY99656.1 Solvent efflux pump srpABC operon corepressor [Acinetobacter baumannii]HCL3094571.1 TetR/AcrR family transcriptional regulator [Pseudomonas aeruginosa AF9A]AJD59206.1 TetR family transcriptional regulator [Pseudomonas aeruginosa]ALU51226.1 TetR family transcriptional regulator [Pseudomonas aeruginosa]ALY62290.1 TetR family transcriptional regulator [Pseudomonas aeruginosa]